MVKVLPRLQRTGLRRGFMQGNSTWLAVGIGAWGLRKLHTMSQRQTEILISEELKPGDRIVIANDRATLESANGRNQTVALTKPKRRTKKRSEGAVEVGEWQADPA